MLLPIDKLLTNYNLSKLVAKCGELKRLNCIFEKILSNSLAEHCKISKIQLDTLFVIVDNSIWASKVRYAIPDLLKELKFQPEFQETLQKQLFYRNRKYTFYFV